MMELHDAALPHIMLGVNVFGEDLVVLSLDSGSQIMLTPQNARLLATKLVLAVSRAEVRDNLKRKHNLSRRFDTRQDSRHQTTCAK
jgi:hypothetical protein